MGGGTWTPAQPSAGLQRSRDMQLGENRRPGRNEIYVATGHGMWLQKYMTAPYLIPLGVTIVFWVEDEQGLDDDVGRRVDTRSMLDEFATDYGAGHPGLPQVRVAGQMVRNYCLTAPVRLRVGAAPADTQVIRVPVGQFRTLQEIVDGIVQRPLILHWSACRTHWNYFYMAQMMQCGAGVGPQLDLFARANFCTTCLGNGRATCVCAPGARVIPEKLSKPPPKY